MSGLEPLLIAGLASAAGAASTAAAPLSLAAAGTAAAGTGISLGTIGTAAGIGGSILSGVGALTSAKATSEAQRAEAEQLERQAGETRAASQRNAERKQKEAELVISRQQAVAADSGAGATDPTVLDLMARTAGEGQLQASTIQYEGDERAAGLTYQAALKKAAADSATTAGYIGAGTSLLSGLNSWDRYRRGYSNPSSSYWAGQA